MSAPPATPGSGPNPGPGYPSHPGYKVTLTPCAKRVRGVLAGETVVDSLAAVLLHETAHTPVYYFPRDDVRQDLLAATGHTTHCPFKGDAAYWTLAVGDRVVPNAVWGYPRPYDEVPALGAYQAFYWHAVDTWWEEDEQVFVHPRDPYVRVDILASSRRVEVVLNATLVAASTRALFVFETGLPTRYYLPRDDVAMHRLSPTDTRTSCPYKGDAEYWSATVAGKTYPDVAWSYPDPIPDATRLQDRICFFNEHVDAITVDGVVQPTPQTKWS